MNNPAPKERKERNDRKEYGALAHRLAPFGLGLAIAIVFWGAFQSLRVAVPTNEVWLGWTYYDIPSYYANAREVFENGNGLFYANPYSMEPNSPRIFTNLQITIMAWLWKLGVGYGAQELFWRVLSLPLMYGFLWWIVAGLVPPGRARLWTYGVAAVGGGVTVIPALGSALAGWLTGSPGLGGGASPAGFVALIEEAQWRFEGMWGWWFLNPLRNIVYSTECFYHALFFATIAAVVWKRWTAACVLLVVTWWAHPFTALELGMFLWTWTALEALLEWRRDGKPGPFLGRFLALFIINTVFLYYYGPLMGRSEEQRSLVDAWRGPEALRITTAPLYHVFLSYGPLLLGILWIVSREGRKYTRVSPPHRLLLIWAGMVFVLIHQDKFRIVERPVQPLHFSRGYLYMVLAIWSGLWLRRMVELHPRARRWLVGGAVAVFAVAAADNLLFFQRYIIGGEARERGVVSIPEPSYAMLRRLDAIPGNRLVFAVESRPTRQISYLLNTYTSHRSFLGHGTNSPFLRDRLEANAAWNRKPEAWFLDRIAAEVIVADVGYVESRTWTAEGEGDSMAFLSALLEPKYERVNDGVPEGYALWIRREETNK